MFNSIRADTIAQLKNGYRRKLSFLQLRYSKETVNFLKLLQQEGYINDFEVLEADRKKAIAVSLRYFKNKAAIKQINIVSRPGQRIYIKSNNIPVIVNGFGCAILTTNQGIITSQEAIRKKVGGEWIATIF